MCFYQPLRTAIRNGDLTRVQKLVEIGAGRELLEDAVYGNYIDIVSALIETGVDVNEKISEDGYTILMYASACGHREIVQMLIEVGADVNVLSEHGDFALLVAARNDRQAVFDYLAPLTSPELRNIQIL